MDNGKDRTRCKTCNFFGVHFGCTVCHVKPGGIQKPTDIVVPDRLACKEYKLDPTI